jgi:hypothetical protein
MGLELFVARQYAEIREGRNSPMSRKAPLLEGAR